MNPLSDKYFNYELRSKLADVVLQYESEKNLSLKKAVKSDFFDNSFQEWGYNQTVKLMYFLKENKFIEEENYKNADVLDFGAGVGGSSIFFHGLGNRVTAVDLDEDSLAPLKSRGYFPKESIVCGDGIELMRKTSEKVYDLVFALMFGPTKNDNFINTFLAEASRVIKDNGKVVVFSEESTMSHFIESEKGKKVTLPSFIGGAAYIASK